MFYLQKTSWLKKFCVLYRKTEDNHPYLEFYESHDAFVKFKQKKGKGEVKRIELHQVRSIQQSSQKTNKGAEYQIEIKGKGLKLVLMLTSDKDGQDWYAKLNNTVDIAVRGDDGSSSGTITQPDIVSLDDSDGENDEVITVNNMYGSGGNGKNILEKFKKFC